MNYKSDIKTLTNMYENMTIQNTRAQKIINDWNTYGNSKIYTIRSHKTDKYYIGSTTQPLHKRFLSHKTHYKSQPFYVSSFEILKFDDAYIQLYKNFPCLDRRQLQKHEDELVQMFLHEIVNKITKNTKHSKYNSEFTDHITNRIEIDSTTFDSKKQNDKIYKKQYYNDNHNKQLNKALIYRNANKNKINQKRRKQIVCECGEKISIAAMARHKRSQKHKVFIESK